MTLIADAWHEKTGYRWFSFGTGLTKLAGGGLVGCGAFRVMPSLTTGGVLAATYALEGLPLTFNHQTCTSYRNKTASLLRGTQLAVLVLSAVPLWEAIDMGRVLTQYELGLNVTACGGTGTFLLWHLYLAWRGDEKERCLLGHLFDITPALESV